MSLVEISVPLPSVTVSPTGTGLLYHWEANKAPLQVSFDPALLRIRIRLGSDYAEYKARLERDSGDMDQSVDRFPRF